VQILCRLAERLAVANAGVLAAGPSQLEGGAHPTALHLCRAADGAGARLHATRAPTEVYHVHPVDGSAHCILSATDARTLCELGWGERHPLSGRFGLAGGIPSTFVMVYAPRSEEDLVVHEMCARAAAAYALGGERDVKA
jgi:hypothetical protein